MKTANFATILGFLKKEFAQVLRDPKMRIILLVLPLMQMMVFGLAISTEVRNIKLGTIYNPNDSVFRRIEERSFSSKWFIPARGRGTINTLNADPNEQIRSGRADVVLISPPGGLTKALARGEGQVQLLIDATNVIRAQSIERYMSSIINEVLRDEFHVTATTPITFDVRILYNPALESAIFMVPGTMAMILCIVTILLTSMSIAREKEMGTFEMIISAPVKTWEVLLGKNHPLCYHRIDQCKHHLPTCIYSFQSSNERPYLATWNFDFSFYCHDSKYWNINIYIRQKSAASNDGWIHFFIPLKSIGRDYVSH